MAGTQLGTLWFGADIDLSKLQQKIQSGNKSILDALKIDYDPQSYNQMVSKLKAQLATETFEIKINANTKNLAQNLRQQLTGNNGLSGGVDALNAKIKNQTIAVNALKSRLEQLGAVYAQQKKSGLLIQANSTFSEMTSIKKELALEKQTLADMVARRTALNHATRDTLLALKREKALHKETANTANQSLKKRISYTRQLNSDSIRLNTTLAGGVHISTQLGSALSSVFAIDYIRTFLSNVIEIGGQLEKQRISIGAILGDTVKATHLFEQIKGLALKSPFGVVELDQYTKQLSAYGFKYSELFDMTKRLADISAGAGTDIGRLTLALGHVRSATYLTGITLRQFSMNNIPMLKMLADYYTEVEKKAVSTAEVQQRISKRQVSYEDVIEQIRRLTDEGGMFYNMQEKISESVAAKFKNLRDAMDIMYGEMAESSLGDFLKGTAELLLKTTRHWNELAHVLAVVGVAFLLSKTRILANTLAMTLNTAATVKQIIADKQAAVATLRREAFTRQLTVAEKMAILTSNQLTVADMKQALAVGVLDKKEALRIITLNKIKIAQAMHLKGVQGITAAEIKAATAADIWAARLKGVAASLKSLFLSIGKGTWTTLGFMAAMELYMGYKDWNDKIDDKANEMKDLIKSRIIDLEKIQRKLRDENKPKDKTALKGRVDEMKQVLANSEKYTVTLDEQLSKAKDLNEQYDILSKAIGDAVENNRKMLDSQDTAASLIKASSHKNDFTKKYGILGYLDLGAYLDRLFNDDISENIQDINDAYKDLRNTLSTLTEFKEPFKQFIDELIKSGEISEELKEKLKDSPFEEQIRLLVENGYWDKLNEKINETGKQFKMSEKDIAETSKRLKGSVQGVADKWGEVIDDDIPKMFDKLVRLQGGNEEKTRNWCIQNIEDFQMVMDGILDQIGEKEPHIRMAWERMFLDYVRFRDLEEGLAEGAKIGGLGNVILKREKQATIKDQTNGDPTKVDKKDKQLEAAKTKLAEYKAFLSEYKKYREHYDKESAINILEGLFPSLKDKGTAIVDNYISLLDELKLATDKNAEARKKFNNELDKTKADTSLEDKKRELKENADAMKEYYTKMEEQWKNYRSLLEKSGGNREIAQMAFNDKGRIWDETAKNMLETFNKKVKELGVSLSMDFNWNMNETQLKEELRNADGILQDELLELAKQIQKVTKGNFVKFIEDTATAYKKSLTDAQKLKELEEQRNDLIKQRNAANSEEDKKKYDVQIAAKDKEIASQTWEAFKETEQWGRIFANLDNISTTTLENMLQKLREVAPQLQKNEEVTKQIYEAMDKMQAKLAERSPFKMIAEGFTNASKIRAALKVASSDKSGSVLANAELAKILKVKVGSKVSKNQLQDALENAEGKIPEGLRGLMQKFKDLQDVLSPVIDLFDQLGMTELSDFFNIGNNALGAAAQTASGLNALKLGSLSPYGAAAAAGVSLVSSLFALNDKNLQKEIEASQARQKEMSNLTENIERILKRTLGGQYNLRATDQMLKELQDVIGSQYVKKPWGEKTAYTSDKTKEAVKNAEKTKTYYDYTYASLLAQRDEVAHQMETEQKKKKSDATAIQNYKKDLAELDDEIKNFAIDMANALYSIDIKSWASQLGDALFEAWQKGESGAEAFKKKASEIIAELSKNIAVTKLIETAMQPVLDIVVSEMQRTKGLLDEQSVEKIAGQMTEVSTTLPEAFNALMNGLNEGMKKAGLTDMKELANETKSSTQNGIGKAITEQDTSLWSSYLNAIRLDVSVIRATEALHLPVISTEVHRVSVLAQAQVDHLQQIADNTRRNADAADKIFGIMRSIELGNTKIVIK